MIKQDWNISDGDKKRILSLHESATKKQYLIFEQNYRSKSELPKVYSKDYQINFNFPTGYHSYKSIDSNGNTIIDQFDKEFKKLQDFLITLKKPMIFDVQISSGESGVRNKDNEKGGTPLPPGKLGEMRSNTIEKLLVSYFKALSDEKFIEKVPEINVNDTIIGKSTIKDSPEALEEQFTRVTFKVKGLEKEVTTTTSSDQKPCDLNVQIKIEYIQTYNGNKLFHCCDNAKFTLMLNGVEIKLQGSNSSVFNLNNKTEGRNTCGSRSQILYVDNKTAKKVLSIKEPIDISFRCESPEKCHEAPMLMTVFKDGEQVGESKYLGTAKNRSDRMKNNEVKTVGTMDKCGNITYVDEDSISEKGEGAK